MWRRAVVWIALAYLQIVLLPLAAVGFAYFVLTEWRDARK